MEKITFVLTSCGRQDLLDQTIESFLKFNDYPIEKYIIVEDSGSESMRAHLEKNYASKFEILFNNPKLGQIKSIDKAYTRIETPYIFHCEDDWTFYRSGFIQDSLSLLKEDPKNLQVWLRDLWDTNEHPPERKIRKSDDGVLYRRMTLKYKENWNGFSFNPGLKRLEDYQRIGTYESIGHEKEISRKYGELGYFASILEESAVAHLGDDRHVKDIHEKIQFDKKQFKKIVKALLPPVVIWSGKALTRSLSAKKNSTLLKDKS